MYVVSGATGNTGHIVVEKLLATGKPVGVIGRNAEKLQPFVNKGAKPIIGNLDDPAFVTKAFQDAEAVYAMIPPTYFDPHPFDAQRRLGDTIAGALREVKVPYIVSLSSVGADQPGGVGPVNGLHRQEKLLNDIPNVNVLHLRPGFYMENLYGMLGMIRAGFIAMPLPPEHTMPMIATRDIGAVAGDVLAKPSFKGKTVRELHGQRDLSMAEMTRAVGKAIGKPDLKYIHASEEDARAGMLQAGFNAETADAFLEMYRAMASGRMRMLETRNDTNTTPTSIESFAKGLAAALG